MPMQRDRPDRRAVDDPPIREQYRARIEAALRAAGLPRPDAAVLPLLGLIEDAAVRAAGRGAGVALEAVADLGRLSEASRRARELELRRWTTNGRRHDANPMGTLR